MQEAFSDDRKHELLIAHNISHYCNAELSFIKELDKMRYFQESVTMAYMSLTQCESGVES